MHEVINSHYEGCSGSGPGVVSVKFKVVFDTPLILVTFQKKL